MNDRDFLPSDDTSNNVSIDALLHPAQAFDHPDDVVNDPDLTLNEKRAILASWASDACAVEAAPAFRCAPGRQQPVQVDDILQALRSLDKIANARRFDAAGSRRLSRRRVFEAYRRRRRGGESESGPQLSS